MVTQPSNKEVDGDKTLMKKYEHQLSLRLPKQLSDGLTKVCENYNVNESEYIRKSVAKNLVNDLQMTSEEINRLNYV